MTSRLAYCAMSLCLILGVATTNLCAAKQMNVLFIAIDDLRPELATYQADGIRTPHIDRLAAKGLQFNAAYCQYPVCNPSRSSFLTGLRPDELGILSNRVALRRKWPDLVTLPQLFRNNGYFTAGLGKLFHMGTDAAPGKSGQPVTVHHFPHRSADHKKGRPFRLLACAPPGATFPPATPSG